MTGERIVIALVRIAFLCVPVLLFLALRGWLSVRRAERRSWRERSGLGSIVIVFAYWLVLPLLFVTDDIASTRIVYLLGGFWLITEPIAVVLAMAMALFVKGRVRSQIWTASTLMLVVFYFVSVLAME